MDFKPLKRDGKFLRFQAGSSVSSVVLGLLRKGCGTLRIYFPISVVAPFSAAAIISSEHLVPLVARES
jgi:hypothetical protein